MMSMVEVLDEAGPSGGAFRPRRGNSGQRTGRWLQLLPESAAPAAGAGSVPSPLAGKVVSISVNVGDSVKEGDTVIVLEAMKMNTLVTAPATGTVSAILVKPGDAVEEGQALVTIS